MAHKPGSQELAQHSQHKPHHYKGDSPEVHREADKVLEALVQELMEKRGLTREAALKHARYWV